MSDNINVHPSSEDGRVAVATDEVDSVHYPVYKQAFSEESDTPTHVSSENPLPIESNQLLFEIRAVQHTLNHILEQTKLQTEILKETFNSTLTERDLP